MNRVFEKPEIHLATKTGANITEALYWAREMALNHILPVVFEFSGREIVVTKESNLDELERLYYKTPILNKALRIGP